MDAGFKYTEGELFRNNEICGIRHNISLRMPETKLIHTFSKNVQNKIEPCTNRITDA